MRYFFLLLMLITGTAYGQLMQANNTPGGYQWVASKNDSLQIMPRGNDTINIGPTKFGKSTVGAQFFKLADKSFWIRDSTKWNKISGSGGGGGTITSVTGNLPISVDNTDPANPIINFVNPGYILDARTLTINGTAHDLSADRSWTVGDVLTSGSYSNPTWITSLAFSKITFAGTNLQYVRGDGTLATFPTNVSTFTNDASYITTAGARTAISLTTTGSGAATYNNSTGVLNVPTPSAGGSGTVTSIATNFPITGGTITTTGTLGADTVSLFTSLATRGRVAKTIDSMVLVNNVRYILNQTSQQASSNYNITGAGVIGASLLVGGTTLGTSAIVDIQSTTKAFFIPRATITQINAVSSPAQGGSMYSSTDSTVLWHNGTRWELNIGLYNPANASYRFANAGYGGASATGRNYMLGQDVMKGAGVTTGLSNTGLGWRALYLLTSGLNNIAIGNQALQNDSSGSVNIAIGVGALLANRSGGNNIAIGDGALGLNVVGNFNVAGGTDALSRNTGSNNAAWGYKGLELNTSGSANTAMGANAAKTITLGGSNTAVGSQSLSGVTTTSNNTGVGSATVVGQAGSNNTGVGSNSLGSGKTGANGSENTAVGANSMNNYQGASSTGIGYETMSNDSGVTYISAAGYQAAVGLRNNTKVTAMGFRAMYSNPVAGNTLFTGSNITCIGCAMLDTANSNIVAIGNNNGVNVMYKTSTAGITFNNSNTAITTFENATVAYNFPSTTGGILFPKMTTTQKNLISSSSPVEGTTVYDLTLHKLYVWDGAVWQAAW